MLRANALVAWHSSGFIAIGNTRVAKGAVQIDFDPATLQNRKTCPLDFRGRFSISPKRLSLVTAPSIQWIVKMAEFPGWRR